MPLRVFSAVLLSTLAAAAMLAPPAAAQAQPADPFEVGQREFAASHFEAALQAFQQANRPGSPRVVLLWLGETCRALYWNGGGKPEQNEAFRKRAVDYLQQYVREVKDDPGAAPDEKENARQARAVIARLATEVPPWMTPEERTRAAVEEDRSAVYVQSAYEVWRTGTGVSYGIVIQPFAFLGRRLHFGLSGLEQVTGASEAAKRIETIGGFVGYQWWPNKYLVPYARVHVEWNPAARNEVWLSEGGVTVYPGVIGYITAGAGYSSLVGPEFSIGIGIHWAVALLVAANLP